MKATRLPIVLIACAVTHPAAAEGWSETFTDPTDGRFDASRWLLDRRGALPVPLVITEPAVGYGGGIGLLYFHRKEGAPKAQGDPRSLAPPSVSGVLGAATENGTKLGAAAHLGIWRDDTLRYMGAVAAMSVNLTFYGGEEFPQLEDGVDYNLDGWATFQQLMWRFPKTDFWLGVQAIYFDADAALEEANAPPAFSSLNGQVTNAAAGVAFSYDGRDNIFTPSRGFQSEWNVREHWGEFNGDFDYLAVTGKNRWYFQPGKPWVLGWRLDASYTSGGAPFYARPYINQRGIPRARYQGDVAFTTEVETRYNFDGRWFGVAFAGVGRAGSDIDDLGQATSRWAGGLGVRYLLARALGLQSGLDIARGPEEWAFYLQVGSAWSF